MSALHRSLRDAPRDLLDEEAALVARCLHPCDAGHVDVVEAVAGANEVMQRSPGANFMLVGMVEEWLAAMRAGTPPRANEPQLAAQIEALGAEGLRDADDRQAVRRGVEALRSLVACVEQAAAIVALPVFAPHLASLEARFGRLPTFARVRCAEAMVLHRGNADAQGILTRARDRLLDHAANNPARLARVAPFVKQFDGWLAALSAP